MRKWKPSRLLSCVSLAIAASVCLFAGGASAEEQAEDQAEQPAVPLPPPAAEPFDERREIHIDVPFVRVRSGPEGTRVDAPFTRVRRDRAPLPPVPERHPPHRPDVRIEIDGAVDLSIPSGRGGTAWQAEGKHAGSDRERRRRAVRENLGRLLERLLESDAGPSDDDAPLPEVVPDLGEPAPLRAPDPNEPPSQNEE